MERRKKRISTNVEDLVFDLVTDQIVRKEDITLSDYLRALIIKDLDNREMLPELAKDLLIMGIEALEVA